MRELAGTGCRSDSEVGEAMELADSITGCERESLITAVSEFDFDDALETMAKLPASAS